jgi:AcrR family transcriptional regulator
MSDSVHSARRLPRGSHGIPAEVVARNQRERLVAAMAEVCAEEGYVGASVEKVARRAGVSSVTFYEQFAGKRECLLAAHRELLGRLLEELDRAREAAGEGEREKSRAALRALLELLAADPPTARLLAVEALAAGPEGAARHDVAVRELAARLLPGAEAAAGAPLPEAEWARAAGVLALVGRLTMAGESGRLPEVEQDLAAMLATRL